MSSSVTSATQHLSLFSQTEADEAVICDSFSLEAVQVVSLCFDLRCAAAGNK